MFYLPLLLHLVDVYAPVGTCRFVSWGWRLVAAGCLYPDGPDGSPSSHCTIVAFVLWLWAEAVVCASRTGA
jgi:hypothetical protein